MPKIKKGFTEISIDKLVKADWNYKEDDEVLQDKLKANIKRNGQIENIIVRELDTGFYEVVNGNHRYSALIDLDFKKVTVYNLGDISQAQAQRIAIETNETRFNADMSKLSELMNELSDEFTLEDLQETMPCSDEHLDTLLKEVQEQSQQQTDSDFDKKIFLKVPEETYNIWLDWLDKLKMLTGIDNESRAFEYAIIEALNIPDESLQK